MFFYLIVILMTTVLAYLYENTKKIYKKLVFPILIALPSMISGLRGVGTDYELYLKNYNGIIQGTYEFVDYKSIMVQIIRILGKYGICFQVSVFLISTITIYIAFKIFKEYEKNINFTFAIFSYMTIFFQMSMNIYRQMLAAEIFLLATVYLYKKNNIVKYWFWYIVAVLIHSSILPFGLVFFFRRTITEKKYQKKRIILYIVALIIIIILPSLTYLNRRLSGILSHYAWYLTRFEYTGIGLGLIRYLVLAIIPATFIASTGLDIEMNDKGLHYVKFYSMLGAVLWMTSYVSVSTIYRISYNLLVVLPIMHGVLYKKYCSKQRLLISCAIFIIMILFWYYDGMILNTGETVPYLFFWQK